MKNLVKEVLSFIFFGFSTIAYLHTNAFALAKSHAIKQKNKSHRYPPLKIIQNPYVYPMFQKVTGKSSDFEIISEDSKARVKGIPGEQATFLRISMSF